MSARDIWGLPTAQYDKRFEVATNIMNSPLVTIALWGNNDADWSEAIKSEMQSLWENEVFEEVYRLAGKNVIGTKWVLRVKTNSEGRLD